MEELEISKGQKQIGNSTERLTESTNLDPWEPSESEHNQNKEHKKAGTRLLRAHVADRLLPSPASVGEDGPILAEN